MTDGWMDGMVIRLEGSSHVPLGKGWIGDPRRQGGSWEEGAGHEDGEGAEEGE